MNWRGVLIAESLDEGEGVWDRVKETGRAKQRLEREGSRGEFTFCHVEVTDEEVDPLLQRVAELLRSPGWYFHVERDRVIKVAFPGRVMEYELRRAREYPGRAGVWGIDRDSPGTAPLRTIHGQSVRSVAERTHSRGPVGVGDAGVGAVVSLSSSGQVRAAAKAAAVVERLEADIRDRLQAQGFDWIEGEQ